MKHSVRLLAVVVSMMFIACQQKETKETSPENETSAVVQLRKDVIAVHDEVMPLMSKIYQLKNKLRSISSSGSAKDSDKTEIDSALKNLDSADQGMRVWMREFAKLDVSGLNEEEATRRLNAEMEKIKKVKADMEGSVKVAEEITRKWPEQ
jgi:hypothetical protein